MKCRKTMKVNGFELSSYSKTIQAEANRIEDLTNQKNGLRKQLSEEPNEALEDELNELEDSINEQDSELVAKINKYDNNREHYAKLGVKLKESREAKQQAKANPAPAPEPQPETAPAPAPEPQPEPQPEPAPAKAEEKKKSGGGGTLLAIGLLVVGSIIGVNLLKKK